MTSSNKAPQLPSDQHRRFARVVYNVHSERGDTLPDLFNKIVAKCGYLPLTQLPARTKRTLLHNAATIPCYGKLWFEKQCHKRFLSKLPKIKRRMEHRANKKHEVSALWDVYKNIYAENKVPLGALPSNTFYRTQEWLRFRYLFLSCFGKKCSACGSRENSGRSFEVDHIRPRHLYPELAFRPDNLQVLCGECHRAKRAGDSDSWVSYSSAVGGVQS